MYFYVCIYTRICAWKYTRQTLLAVEDVGGSRGRKGGQIKATQRNNQCSLRVIIPLLNHFDCFKGVTRIVRLRRYALLNDLLYYILSPPRLSLSLGGPTTTLEGRNLSVQEIISLGILQHRLASSSWVMPYKVTFRGDGLIIKIPLHIDLGTRLWD